MFDEVVGEFRRMWKAEEYPGFDGTHFSMPARNVLPKPYTNPHPPMWVAAGSPSTFQKAAQMGLGVLCFTLGGAEPLKPLIELYKKEIQNADPVGDYVNDNIMVTTQLLCLEDGARVRQVGSQLHGGYQNSLVFRYLDTFPRPDGIPVWPDLIPERTPEEIDDVDPGRERHLRHARGGCGRAGGLPTPQVSTRSCSACCRRRCRANSRSK